MKGKLIMTVEEAQDRKAWEELRNKGIGGSDAAVIVGKNPWKSPYTLWAEKTGKIELEDLSNNEFVEAGNRLEQTVAEWFCDKTGKKVRRCGTLADEEVPYLMANVDRLIIGENAGLECKTANAFKGKDWEGDEVPAAYILQCQWYMMITGAEKWYIACLIGGNHFVWKEVPRNDDDIKALREAAISFWVNNVEANMPPDTDGTESTSDTLSKQYGQGIYDAMALPSSAADWIARLDNLNRMEKMIAEQKTEATNALKAMLGDYERGSYDDRIVSWVNVKARVSIDTKRLQAELPQVYEQYKKVGKPTRMFKVK